MGIVQTVMKSTKKIVIFEPNDLHFELTTQKLFGDIQLQKYTTIHFKKIFELKRFLRHNSPTLILLCITQEMDPHQVKLILKVIDLKNVVIILSDFHDEALSVELIKMGADDFLIKNKKNLADLPDTIKKALKKTKKIPKSFKTKSRFSIISENVKILAQMLNQPAQGLAVGKDQLNKLEIEIELIKNRLKDFIAG